MAANGGTRTSTVRPGTRCSSRPRLYRTAARSAGRSGGEPAASASVTAARLAAPSARSVASPDHGARPSAHRCSLTAASSLARSGPRGGTTKHASRPRRQRAAACRCPRPRMDPWRRVRQRNFFWNFRPSDPIADLMRVLVRYARSAQVSGQPGQRALAPETHWPRCGDSAGGCGAGGGQPLGVLDRPPQRTIGAVSRRCAPCRPWSR